jgi:DnaA family protein
MLSEIKQLPLKLKLPQFSTFDSYHGNEEVVAYLKNLIHAEEEALAFLWGTTSVGKTHLLQAACEYASNDQIPAVYLGLSEFSTLAPELLEGLENIPLICLDDITIIAKNKEWEEALFHLFNRHRQQKGKMIVTSNAPSKKLPFALPDLTSRLTWGANYEMKPLADNEKYAAIKKHAKARGLELSEEVGEFLIRRCPREMSHLIQVLDQLDKSSLVAQRKLTIPFVKQVLGI